jgi:uncharacterized protein YceH (UPF0502 family)
MDVILDDVEARLLGCLMEKERTTPEYYPLTLNALTRACNQKSNRSPVMALSEETVVRVLDRLFDKKMGRRVISDDSRVPKYRHTFDEAFEVGEAEMAVVCVLLLRGPQTVGEIRGRTERLHTFEALQEVEDTLDRLAALPGGALVTRLPRQPGTKESRFAHLLCGEVAQEAVAVKEPAALRVEAEDERIERLEAQVASLQEDLDTLKAAFARFQSQFE